MTLNMYIHLLKKLMNTYTFKSIKVVPTADEAVVITAVLLHQLHNLTPGVDRHNVIRGDMLLHDYMHYTHHIGLSTKEEDRLSSYISYCCWYKKTIQFKPDGLTDAFINDFESLINHTEYARIYNVLFK